MRMLRGRKALSPVVASIILIAVTVAVSIAVAAWMGALSFSFMNSGEQLQLGSPYGWTNGGATVKINVACPGGSKVTITSVRINGTAYTGANIAGSAGLSISPTSSTILTVSNVAPTFISGYYYQIIVVTAKNNEFQTTGFVP